MRLQIRSTLFLFIFFLFSSLSIGALVPDQVITADEIQQAGLIRLTDLYSLMDDWNSYTIDGYTWHSSPGGNELMNNDWLLLVDGKKIFLESLDGKNLNHLPINVTTIDSVTIFSRPVFYNGHFSTDGIISIVTKKPGKGVTWDSNYNLGNETKDPGPYTFIDEKDTPNVDKIGPDYSNSFSLAKDSDYARLHIIEHGHFNTDPNIKERMEIANRGVYPKMENNSYSAEASLKSNYSDISVFYYNTRHRDFYESHATQASYPVYNELKEIALSIRSNSNEKYSLVFNANYSYDQLDDVYDYQWTNWGDDFHNWHRTKFESSIGVHKSSGGFSGGIRVDQLKQDHFLSVINKDDLSIYNPQLNLWKNGSNFLFAINAKYAYRRAGGKVFFQLDKQIKNIWNSSLALSYTLSSPYESPEFWAWTSKSWFPNGYGFHDSPHRDQQEKRFQLNLQNKFKISDHISYKMVLDYSFFNGYDLDYFHYYFPPNAANDPRIRDYSSTTYHLVRIEKNTLRLSNIIKHRLSDSFRHELNYRVSLFNKYNNFYPVEPSIPIDLSLVATEVNVDDEREYEGYSRVPLHVIRYNIVYSTPSHFTAGLYLKWQSNVKWGAVGTLDDMPDTDAFFNMDIAISKGFWKNRARLTFKGQNLLNDEIQYHPFGAGVYDLTFWTKLDIHLNSADLLGR